MVARSSGVSNPLSFPFILFSALVVSIEPLQEVCVCVCVRGSILETGSLRNVTGNHALGDKYWYTICISRVSLPLKSMIHYPLLYNCVSLQHFSLSEIKKKKKKEINCSHLQIIWTQKLQDMERTMKEKMTMRQEKGVDNLWAKKGANNKQKKCNGWTKTSKGQRKYGRKQQAKKCNG